MKFNIERRNNDDCLIVVSYEIIKKLIKWTLQKMKYSIKDFFSKYDQFHSFLRIWSHLLKKSVIENLIFCAVGTRNATI